MKCTWGSHLVWQRQQGWTWLSFMEHRKFLGGWAHAVCLSSQPVLNICVSHLNTCSSIFGSRGHPHSLKSEALPLAVLPLSWGRAHRPGCAGARDNTSWDTAWPGHCSCPCLCSLNIPLSTNAHVLGLPMHYGEQPDQPSLPSSPPMVEQLKPPLCFFVSLRSFSDLHRGKYDLLFRYLSANSPS